MESDGEKGKSTRERANKTLLATRHFHVASCHYTDTHAYTRKYTHTHTHTHVYKCIL